MRGPIVCALALLSTTASAQPKARSLADCTTFEQADKDDVTVDLKVHNSCSIPVDCTVSWKVVCAPQSKKRRSEHPESRKLSLVEGTGGSTEASAAVCGDDAWSIEAINWTCSPNKE